MFELRDLFQWERFITPSIIKIFYWLVVVIGVLYGLGGIMAGVRTLSVSPLGGMVEIFMSLLGTLVGIIMARIGAEFVLIIFRMNEHLGAIRNQRGM